MSERQERYEAFLRWYDAHCAEGERIIMSLDEWAPIGSLGNVLDLLDKALAEAVGTVTTNPPGVEGLAGQALTSWVNADLIELARDRLRAALIREGSPRANARG